MTHLHKTQVLFTFRPMSVQSYWFLKNLSLTLASKMCPSRFFTFSNAQNFMWDGNNWLCLPESFLTKNVVIKMGSKKLSILIWGPKMLFCINTNKNYLCLGSESEMEIDKNGQHFWMKWTFFRHHLV